MGFWEKIFGKKKAKEETDGQEQYFKEDFAPIANRQTVKKDENTPEPQSKSAPKKAAAKPKKATPSETKDSSTAANKKPSDKAATPKIEKKPTSSKAEKPKSAAKPKASAEINDDSPEVKGASTVKESKATANGKFDIRKAKDGRFFFSLYASNHTVIAYSQIYSSVSAVNTGINSVIANATKAEIEDTTLKKPVSLPCPKWEIYIDKAEQYRFRLYASNGLCVCHSSHGYTTKSGCKGGIDSIRRFAAEARVDKSYLK